MSTGGQRDAISAEFKRLNLSPESMPYAGLAFENVEASEQFLLHLRSLSLGATWRDIFPDLGEDDEMFDGEDEYADNGRPLGPFDYQHPPRGSAIFAYASSAENVDAAAAAMQGAIELGLPVHGAGLVLDRGHPHLYIVLPLGAPEDHVRQIEHYLREHPGIGNAYPQRIEAKRERGS